MRWPYEEDKTPEETELDLMCLTVVRIGFGEDGGKPRLAISSSRTLLPVKGSCAWRSDLLWADERSDLDGEAPAIAGKATTTTTGW